MLMRHSVREELPADEVGDKVPITEDGDQLARKLGALLGERLKSLHTSPVLRCVQTAEAIRKGMGTDMAVQHNCLLGAPGVYVLDGHRAWIYWKERGHESVMEHLVSADDSLPGMAVPDFAARFLVQHMLSANVTEPGIHAYVTHDLHVTTTAARLFGVRLGKDAWPWYLEAAFFWRDEGGVHVAYRDRLGRRAGALCALTEGDVIEFARREIAATVGLDCPARFFLAGGAFKTLLTGRPPRDLDLWAPSEQDRELLIETLEKRGGLKLDLKPPYREAFRLGDRVIEVSDKTEPSDLEERLGLSDIALSAVGVEHRPGDSWRAAIHPLAQASVERGEILLLKPLVNWRHALGTLERARRYAAELSCRVPTEEEGEVWRVFDSQSPEMRQGMIERFNRTTLGGHGVGEEALCRP
jgi:broad specificity phosphatase PhoE